MRNKGVTFIELVVVISIIGILAIALGFSFVGWQGKYSVEETIKDLYSDLVDARARAMMRKRTHFAVQPTDDSYSLVEDTNQNGVNDSPGDTVLPTFPKELDYDMTWTGGGLIIFDTRGIIWPTAAPAPLIVNICIFTDLVNNSTRLPPADGLSDSYPDFDCIIVTQTSINIGKLDTQNTAGGACDSANCIAK